MLPSFENCQDFRDLPSRNPVTKQDFDLINGRADFELYRNNCPQLTEQEVINKYDDKFCAAFFSSIDNSGNFIEPWTGRQSEMQNPTGAFEYVSKICGFREPETRIFPATRINCNTGGINDCISFQPVNNRMEIRAWLDAQHRYIENLHVDDRTLITDYESMDSFRWNNVLRGIGKPCDRQNNETPDQFADKFQRFYNLILKAPRTPRMYAYRGIRINQFEFFNKEQDDKIIENKGFTSLSINMNIAALYAYYTRTVNPWVFDTNLNNGQFNVLEIPLGTPALFVSSRPGNQIEGKYELVLLPHTVKFVSVDTSISIPLVMNHNNPLNLTRIYMYKYMSSIPLNTYFPKGIDTIPSESIINDFITYCKNYAGANQFFVGGILSPSVIKGGFGINKLLNHRYKAINLNPTGDLDIEVYSNNLVSFNTKIQVIENLLNNFVGSIQTRFPTFNPVNNPVNRLIVQNRTLVANSQILLSLRFTPCGDKPYIENIIDIKINLDNILFGRLTNPVTIPQILDNDLSIHLGIPIKNVTAYLEELKDLLRRTIVNGADPITRNSRNPYLAPSIDRRNKGKKTIERAKTLCSIDSRARNDNSLREMCKILSRLSMREILPSPASPNIADLNNAATQLQVRFGATLNP